MIYPKLVWLLLFLIPSASFAQAELPALPPIGTNMTLSVEQILALAEQPDDRSQMIPEIKAIIANAREWSCRVVILTAEGQSHYPPLFIVKERWVAGEWVISSSTFDDFPGEDKVMVQAMTYDPKSQTFLRFHKSTAMKKGDNSVEKELGKQVGDARKIRWEFETVATESKTEAIDTYTDTSAIWKQVMTEKGVYKMTITGSASKRR